MTRRPYWISSSAHLKTCVTWETALDGQEALDKLFETPYDLIILGIMLPNKEGYPSCGKFGKRT